MLMKTLLINPPFVEAESVGATRSMKYVLNNIQPLGLAYIAAVLERKEHPVEIADFCVPDRYPSVNDVLQRSGADVVGLTCTTPSFLSAIAVAEETRRLLPRAKIILGGAHINAAPEEAIRPPCFDIGVLGEGEFATLELVRHFSGEEPRALRDIPGLIFRENDEIVRTPSRPHFRDLDRIPRPARHLLPPLSEYSPTPASYRRLPLGVLMTSRGCPSKCTFCDRAVFGSTYRAHSTEYVLDEVEELVKRYGAKEIRFFDDTFTQNRQRVFEICAGLKRRGLRIPWTCLTKVKAVTPEMLRAMKGAGCWQVLYGLESGDDEMLKRLKKGNTVEDNRRAVRWAQEAGLSVRADFIVGTPGETIDSLRRTLAFALAMGLDYAHFNKFVPFPGTALHAQLTAEGYEFDLSQPCSILDHSAIFYVPEGMTHDEFKAFLDHAFRSFYLRPSYIARRLLQIRTVDQLVGQLKGLAAIAGV